MNAKKFKKIYEEHRKEAATILGRGKYFESREELSNYMDYELLRDKGQGHEEAIATVVAQLPQREREAALEAQRRSQYLDEHRDEIEAAIRRDKSTVARRGLR